MGAVPDPVAVVGDPDVGVVMRTIVGRPPVVGVRSIEHAPVTGHVVDGVRVVVPADRAAPVVEVRVADEVDDPVFLVDRVVVRVEAIGVDVEAILLAPLAQVVGHGVRVEVLVEHHGAVGLCGGRSGQQATQEGRGDEDRECSESHRQGSSEAPTAV